MSKHDDGEKPGWWPMFMFTRLMAGLMIWVAFCVFGPIGFIFGAFMCWHVAFGNLD